MEMLRQSSIRSIHHHAMNFKVDSLFFSYKYAFMYCFPVSDSTPTVCTQYRPAFFTVQTHKEGNERLLVTLK